MEKLGSKVGGVPSSLVTAVLPPLLSLFSLNPLAVGAPGQGSEAGPSRT